MNSALIDRYVSVWLSNGTCIQGTVSHIDAGGVTIRIRQGLDNQTSFFPMHRVTEILRQE